MVLFVKELFFSTSVTYLNTKKKKKKLSVSKRGKYKDKKGLVPCDNSGYFLQLLVTVYGWPCPRNHSPQLHLLSDTWKKCMLKQLTKL